MADFGSQIGPILYKDKIDVCINILFYILLNMHIIKYINYCIYRERYIDTAKQQYFLSFPREKKTKTQQIWQK